MYKRQVNEISENGSDTLINLASEEYFKSLSNIRNKVRVISPVFKDYKNGQFKIHQFLRKESSWFNDEIYNKESDH